MIPTSNSISRNQVKEFCEKLHKQNKKVVFTNGCFDILHLGHISYLAQARELGDFLFIGINSDSSVKKIKGSDRPIQNENDRSQILLSLRCVDGVSIFDEDTPLELIKLVRPDVLVKGGDWAPEKIIGKNEVDSWGGKTLSLPYIQGHSTSEIVRKIQKL